MTSSLPQKRKNPSPIPEETEMNEISVKRSKEISFLPDPEAEARGLLAPEETIAINELYAAQGYTKNNFTPGTLLHPVLRYKALETVACASQKLVDTLVGAAKSLASVVDHTDEKIEREQYHNYLTKVLKITHNASPAEDSEIPEWGLVNTPPPAKRTNTPIAIADPYSPTGRWNSPEPEYSLLRTSPTCYSSLNTTLLREVTSRSPIKYIDESQAPWPSSPKTPERTRCVSFRAGDEVHHIEPIDIRGTGIDALLVGEHPKIAGDIPAINPIIFTSLDPP